MEKLKIGLDKIVIGYDELAQNEHLRQSSSKLEILGEAVQEFKNQFNADVEDIAEFQNGFYDYALNVAKEKHSGGLVLGLHNDQFLNLYRYNLDKLKDIEARYIIQRGSLICVNNIFSIDESLDFKIYAESQKEVEKFNDCIDLIKSVTKIYNKYYLGQGSIQQLQFINRLYVVGTDGTLQPNRFFIKQ